MLPGVTEGLFPLLELSGGRKVSPLLQEYVSPEAISLSLPPLLEGSKQITLANYRCWEGELKAVLLMSSDLLRRVNDLPVMEMRKCWHLSEGT